MQQQHTDEAVTHTSLLPSPPARRTRPIEHATNTLPTRHGRAQRVGFLFNHEQGHQLAHSAPILAALAAKESQSIHLHAFVSSPARRRELRSFLPEAAWKHITLHDIAPPAAARWAEKLTGGAVPLQRIASLIWHRKLLQEMDLLIAPETTCSLLKTHLGGTGTRFVYTQHGAGDRAVGFKKTIARFDHVLVPGRKIRDRMLDDGIIREGGYSLVGYPKFDAVALTNRQRFFPNDNPTVLYNPHFHPALSSWYRDGLKVLEFFANTPHINLIFAPHVMLFTRRLHAAATPPRLKLSGHVPARFRACSNILIDEGSQRSMDMSYTRAADIYLGDASSQVYEFLSKPKPCLFISGGKVDWLQDPNYAHWRLGKVLDSAAGLPDALHDLSWFDDTLKERQRKAFRATFGDAPFGAAERAANVIAALATGQQWAQKTFLPSRPATGRHADDKGEIHV